VDGAVAGFVMVVGDEVEQVYVSRDHRGSGVAALLLGEAERQVRAGGHAKAWLAVVEGNGRARAFYERAGWTDEGSSTTRPPARTARSPCRRRYTKTL
jgi:GNAT superfamily N-acetyltransferase